MSKNVPLQRGQLVLFLFLLNQTISANAAAPDCSDQTIHCVGPGLEFNTSIDHVEKAFQAAANVAKAGDTIAIKGGTYEHKTNSSSKIFLTINASGTSSAPITIKSFDGENAHIKGFGFPEGTEGPSVGDEKLIYVNGDYVHIKNLELSYSSRWGLVLSGSYGLVENVSVHDSWKSNILIYGKDRNIEYNTARYVESYRSRHGTGLWILPSASTPKIIRGTLVENSFLHHNGYQPDSKKVPGVSGESVGGGNSDGIGAFKNCAESAADYKVLNLCPESTLKGNITWHNADDGTDISFGDGSELIDNISYENGPEGNKGFKVYAKVRGGITFTGNVAMGNISSGFELQIDETGYLYNNTSIRNDLHGYRAAFATGGKLTATNNLGAYNKGSRDIETGDQVVNTTNWAENKDGNPQITAPDFSNASVSTEALETRTIAQKVLAIKHQFQKALTPLQGSPLIDAGTIVSGIHCPRADDNATNPMEPTQDCRHWLGKAPDIGAYEFGMPIFNPPMPPKLTVE